MRFGSQKCVGMRVIEREREKERNFIVRFSVIHEREKIKNTLVPIFVLGRSGENDYDRALDLCYENNLLYFTLDSSSFSRASDPWRRPT